MDMSNRHRPPKTWVSLLAAAAMLLQLLPAAAGAAPGGDGGSDIERILTPNAKQIVKDYDKYEPYDLRLPETVKVRTGDGSVYDVRASWDAESLDLSAAAAIALAGTLDAGSLGEQGIANPQDLRPSLAISVVEPANILQNGGFEDPSLGSSWSAEMSSGSRSIATEPEYVNGGAQAVKASGYSQPYHMIGQDIRAALRANGPGEYYMGGWARLGAEDAGAYTVKFRTDIDIVAGKTPTGTGCRVYSSYIPAAYRPFGEADYQASLPEGGKIPQSGGYAKVQNRAMLLWEGAVSRALFLAETESPSDGNGYPGTIYFDDMELIPLNVTLPANNIASYTPPSAIVAAEGTPFESLALPASLPVALEDGSPENVAVAWQKGGYDENAPAVYAIRGIFAETASVFNNGNIVPEISVTVAASGQSPGTAYYFSQSGDDANDGASELAPKKEITQAFVSALKPGDTVLFRRGDAWYDPALSMNFAGVKGTAEWPIAFGAYGAGADPVIAALSRPGGAWSDEGGGAWSVPYSGAAILRVYVDGELLGPGLASGGAAGLRDGEYFLEGGKLYVKGLGNPAGRAEIMENRGGYLLFFQNSEHITFDGIAFKGGPGGWATVMAVAPTKNLVFRNLALTQLYKYGIVFQNDGGTGAQNLSPLIENCVLDRVWSDAAYWNQIANGVGNSDAITCDGILLRNACDGAIIRGNTVTSFGHTGIGLEINGATNAGDGVRNCVIERNVVSGGDSQYLHALDCSGDDRLAGNIFRWNYCYDITVSSHLLGKGNVMFGNIFAYIRETASASTTRQAYAIDLMPWIDANRPLACEGNIVMNNTVFDTDSAIRASGALVGKNLIANNIVASWFGASGLRIESVGEPQIVRGNLFWNGGGEYSLIRQGDAYYTADGANMLPNMGGNMQGDPMFAAPGEGKSDFAARDFSLRDGSPYLNAGLPLSAILSDEFPAAELLKAPGAYADFYGNPYAAHAPSVGAVSGFAAADPSRGLLANPGFEDSASSISPWAVHDYGGGGAVAEIVSGEGAYEGNSARLANRERNYASVRQGVVAALEEWGPGDYYVQAYARQGPGAALQGQIQLPLSGMFNVWDGAAGAPGAPGAAVSGTFYFRTGGNGYPGGVAPPDFAPATVALGEQAYAKISNRLWLDFVPGSLASSTDGAGFIHFQDSNGASEPRADIYLDEWMLVKCDDIVSAEPAAPLVARVGTEFSELALPKAAKVALDGGGVEYVPVSWTQGAYNAGVAGTYVLSGALDLSEYPQLSGRRHQVRATSCEVTLKDSLGIARIPDIAGVKVLYGVPADAAIARLPQKASVVLEDGSGAELDIIWDAGGYNPHVSGAYAFTGAFAATDGISAGGAGGAGVVATVTVADKIGIGENLLENGDAEGGLEGGAWSAAWGGSLLWSESGGIGGGGAMLYDLGSSSGWRSPVQDVTDQLKALGQGTYYMETWVKISGETADPAAAQAFKIFLVVNDGLADNDQNGFFTPDEVVVQPGGDYAKVSGYVTVTWKAPLAKAVLACLYRDHGVYPAATLLIDGVGMRRAELLDNPGFEDGAAGWAGAGDAALSIDADSHTAFTLFSGSQQGFRASPAYRGESAARSSGRTGAHDGPAQDVTANVMEMGAGEYRLSAWAKTGGGAGLLQLGLRAVPGDGGNSAEYLTEASEIGDAEYALCEGTVVLPDSAVAAVAAVAAGRLEFFVKTPGESIPETVFFDDCGLIRLGDAPPMDGPEPPDDETEPPVDEPEPPIDGPEPPVDEPETPVDEPAQPGDETEPPIDGPEPPDDKTEPPIDDPEPPIDEPALPGDEPEPPVDGPVPPADGPWPPSGEPASAAASSAPPSIAPNAPPAETPGAPGAASEAPGEALLGEVPLGAALPEGQPAAIVESLPRSEIALRPATAGQRERAEAAVGALAASAAAGGIAVEMAGAPAVARLAAKGPQVVEYRPGGPAGAPQITAVAVLNADGTLAAVPARIAADGGIAVVLSGGSAILVPLRVEARFADTASLADRRVAAEIERAAAQMLVFGVGGGLFAPDAPVTARQAAAMLLRTMGLPAAWDATMGAAAERGLLGAGVSPDEPMARIGAAAMVVGALDGMGMKPAISPEAADEALKGYADLDLAGLDGGQRASLAICSELGIFQGAGGGAMDPFGILSRSQMASIAVRLQDVLLGR
ncbi:MAG: Ig-like domain-containing protein [Clostridiales bacterium]|jgi:hypothetical protein|nr:Ig-like domain-containing protein [Clostridiales bacterium]